MKAFLSPGQDTYNKAKGAAPRPSIVAASLGNKTFRQDYGTRLAYVSGSMYKGIASKELVVRMGRAGLMGFLGTGGLRLDRIENDLQYIVRELNGGQPYGANLLNNLELPHIPEATVDLLFKYGVRNVEAAAFMQVTPALVRFRLKGAKKTVSGGFSLPHRVIAKVSRPEVAREFMSPAPKRILEALLRDGKITPEEAEIGARIPMSHDICVEADSGGHTDKGVAAALMPAMLRLRDQLSAKHGYGKAVRVGAAGGIGTPEAAAAAFILGADFVLTGSINQCTPESGTSDAAKDLLQQVNVQDTEYAPAGDMFEMGAVVQVLRKGVFFPARANKLYELYRRYNSLEEIDPKTQKQIQERYFRKSFEEVYEETKTYYLQTRPEEIEKAERNPKHKMALIFKWYFVHTTRMAMQGRQEFKVDYQIQCGPAMGAFNQWVKGTDLEDWRGRHVDLIADRLMEATAELLNRRYRGLCSPA